MELMAQEVLETKQDDGTEEMEFRAKVEKKVSRLRTEIRDWVNNRLSRSRDKVDSFSTSQKILCQYQDDLLLSNIKRHASTFFDVTALLYID